MAYVALVLVQIVPVIKQLAAITPYFVFVTLPNVLANLVTVLSDITDVRPDFTCILTDILAFRSRTVLVVAPVSYVSGRVCAPAVTALVSASTTNPAIAFRFMHSPSFRFLLIIDASFAPLLG